MNVSNIIEMISGIALFLFGMVLMGEGLKQVAGNKLEIILYKLTGSPLKGLLFGAGITTVIQSSSATSVMVVGFVNSGIMKVKQAIPIVLGRYSAPASLAGSSVYRELMPVRDGSSYSQQAR